MAQVISTGYTYSTMSSTDGVIEEDSESRQPQPKGKMEQCFWDKPFQLCKPLVVSMSLFGLLFLNCKPRKLSVVTRVYSTAVLLFCWTNFVRLFLSYTNTDTFGSNLFLKILIHCWSLLCCIFISLMYKTCHVGTSLVEFLQQWSSLLSINRTSDHRERAVLWEAYRKYMVRRFGFVVVVSWISLIVNCTFTAHVTFKTDLMDFTAAPVPVSHKFALPMKAVFVISSMYMSAAWIFTLCLFLTIAGANYREFEIFKEDLKKAIDNGAEASQLEYFRRRHQAVSRMLEISDEILRVIIAAGIVFCTSNGLLTLYSLVSPDGVVEDTAIYTAKVLWLILSVFYLVVICFAGGYLNHMAHAPLKLIQNIRIKDVSLKCSLQVNLFLAKLTGESIGLTAMDMFVIDKPTILTITGAFITYFIVLIQFKQTHMPAHVVCNCTGL